jgi:UDP-N-acetyl-2-amino-2-deoxyglucuronate dehydrogenase
MNIGILGTGAIAAKHAQAWLNIGCRIVACSNRNAEKGQEFAARFNARFIPSAEALCREPDVELVDVCTFPDYRIPPLEICGELGKPAQVQKPIATRLSEARRIQDIVRVSGITVGVVSQQRYNDAALFLRRAISAGRLGRLIQADAYVKWYRSPAYYSRPIKGSWATEGGGALINQAIHQVDLLRWLIGPVKDVSARWQLGAVHQIESEDLVNALLGYANGALGVIQASTAIWPGYPERIEIHGSKGSAIMTGDRLTHWDVGDDLGEPPQLARELASGASDPMAISLTPFERQFRELLEAVSKHRQPLVSVSSGVDALAIVEAIYHSCRTGLPVAVEPAG